MDNTVSGNLSFILLELLKWYTQHTCAVESISFVTIDACAVIASFGVSTVSIRVTGMVSCFTFVDICKQKGLR